jgi:hypothetical protein
MTFSQKIKQPIFWPNLAKIAIPFFVILVLISLFMNSWHAIFEGDFNTVSKINFEQGKWKAFFTIKLLASTFYGGYVTAKNMK